MGQGVGAARVEVRHHVDTAAEGAEGQTATEVLAQRRQVGRNAQQLLPPAAGQPRSHHLIEDQQGAAAIGQFAQALQESGIAGNASTRAEHGLDQNGGQRRAFALHESTHRGDVVVGRDDKFVRHVDRRAAVAEVQHATVVAAVEHHHLAPPGVHGGHRNREQVGFGARVGEAQALHRFKARADLGRQHGLAGGMRCQAQALRQRRLDRLPYHRIGVAVQAGGEFPQGVEVTVAIGVPQPASLAARHGQREGLVEQHGAGVSARHHLGGSGVLTFAHRVAGTVARYGIGHGGGAVGVRIGDIHAKHCSAWTWAFLLGVQAPGDGEGNFRRPHLAAMSDDDANPMPPGRAGEGAPRHDPSFAARDSPRAPMAQLLQPLGRISPGSILRYKACAPRNTRSMQALAMRE